MLVKTKSFGTNYIIKHTPHAIGGEMEGWVLLELKRALAKTKQVEVIVIKGVADYGGLSKGDKWQWPAAKAAMNCIHHCTEKTGGIEFSGKATYLRYLNNDATYHYKF